METMQQALTAAAAETSRVVATISDAFTSIMPRRPHRLPTSCHGADAARK